MLHDLQATSDSVRNKNFRIIVESTLDGVGKVVIGGEEVGRGRCWNEGDVRNGGVYKLTPCRCGTHGSGNGSLEGVEVVCSGVTVKDGDGTKHF